MHPKKLYLKLEKYKILIFDLDDTIYPQVNFDTPSLLNVSLYIEKKTKIKKIFVFKKLRKLKKIRRGIPPNLIFNKFFSKIRLLNKKKIIKNCINLFQNYDCKELKNSKSLKMILKKFSKTKTLFLVTNGNAKRQKNKIKNLSIEEYFKKIFILDGKKFKLKPSITNVKFLVDYLKKKGFNKAVYVGDNKDTDRKFAENLGIDYIFYQFPNIKKSNV